MLAGLDAAAPNLPPYFEDEAVFLRQLPQETFNQVDGWASHSYPLRGLVGRNSLSTYQWELFLLRQLGVTKSLPVFITETGWPHQEGIKFRKEYLPQDKVAENFRILFNQLLYDPQVVAVTPFLLNYQSDLFDQFSWRKPHSREFYSQYALTQQLAKTKGQPIQAQKLAINSQLPQKLMAHSTYQIPILVRNQGQAIWDQKEHYSLRLIGANKDWEYFFSDFTNLRPFEEQTIFLYLKTGGELGKYDLRFAIAKDNQIVSDEINWALEISSMVQISFEINLFPKIKTQGENFRILIYDPQERVIFEKDNLGVKNGQGVIEEVRNLVFGQKYRLVILKPYYLPGQKLLTIEDRGNRVVFKFMFPLDYDQDGKFSLADILALLQKPQLISLWWPL